MREIKFRGKRLDNGDWAYGDIYQNRDKGKIYMAGNSSETMGGITHVLWDVDPTTVGQFTGLHDKNGKEIFEGDVVLWDTTDGSAVAPEEVFYTSQAEFAPLSSCRHPEQNFTVIGNIHEHAHLLSGRPEEGSKS